MLFFSVVVVVAALGVIVVEVGATCGSSGHHGIEARRRATTVGRGLTASLLHHGCMITLLAIKFSMRGAPCPDFLVSSHPIIWIEWVLRDVDAGLSRWVVVVLL